MQVSYVRTSSTHASWQRQQTSIAVLCSSTAVYHYAVGEGESVKNLLTEEVAISCFFVFLEVCLKSG